LYGKTGTAGLAATVAQRGQPPTPASPKEQKDSYTILILRKGISMAKTLYERRDEIQERIRQLENQQKQLIQKQKKPSANPEPAG
jgi:hypothetical protein